MSYIAPDSDVIILKGVPIDSDYVHTMRQDSLVGQYNMFYAFKKYELNNYNYQRSDKGKIKVNILCDNLYDCNYMMFRNTAFSNKWFYAFITGRTFVNDHVTEITYAIDVMQTWYFDYEMEHCYVEREHTETDLIGDNLVPEGFDTGELVPEAMDRFTFPDSITGVDGLMYEIVVFYVPNNSKNYISSVYINSNDEVVITHTPVKDGNDYDVGGILNGIYMGCKFYGEPLFLTDPATARDTLRVINAVIADISGSDVEGQVVNIVQVPYSLWHDWLNNGSASWNKLITQDTKFYNAAHTKSFTPKNKKMYTFPYRKLEVSNNGGEKANFKWENFTATHISGGGAGEIGKATLKITGVPVISPELMCYPANYNSIADDYEDGIMITDFPNPPWSVDSYAQWLSQNKSAIMYSTLATSVLAIGGTLATVATGGALAPLALAGAGLAIDKKISGDITKGIQAKNTADQFKGQLNISSLRTVQHRVGYFMYDLGVEYNLAKSIDDFFTMFGYAVKEVKIPNIRKTGALIRPCWNYVKTNGCTLHASSGSGLSAEDETMIAQIYDKGITFWNVPSEVGKYNLDNSPSNPPI